MRSVSTSYFKIDGDFIRGFGANPTDQFVVEAIVGIARGMGKKTVAEFVTDQAMTDRLRRSAIDYAQGFHIGMPPAHRRDLCATERHHVKRPGRSVLGRACYSL